MGTFPINAIILRSFFKKKKKFNFNLRSVLKQDLLHGCNQRIFMHKYSFPASVKIVD